MYIAIDVQAIAAVSHHSVVLIGHWQQAIYDKRIPNIATYMASIWKFNVTG